MELDYQRLSDQWSVQKVWCKEKGASEKSYYYWQQILRNEAYIEMKQLPVSPPVTLPSEPQVEFVELKPTPKETVIQMSLRSDIIICSGRLVLEISNNASVELLVQLGGILHVQWPSGILESLYCHRFIRMLGKPVIWISEMISTD